MGIKFQAHYGGPNSQIVIHVRMLDAENALQQKALGIVGVNLVYGTCFLHDEPEALLDSLLDSLSTLRIEIDLIEFSGDAFSHEDNRGMSLRLVQLGLTGAAMFSADGKVLQPSEVLYKKPVLVERGRFRPVTHVNLDLAASALRKFEEESDDVLPGETVSIMEITMSNLLTDGELDFDDFISRIDVLAITGHTVMISGFFEYYRLAAYMFRYTNRRIGLAMRAPNLKSIFDESYYDHLKGGILESCGHLFRNNLRLYIYPWLNKASGELVTIDTLDIDPSLQKLYEYLVERGCIVQLEDINRDYLSIFSPEVLSKINPENNEWEAMVPVDVADVIKSRGLFGFAQS